MKYYYEPPTQSIRVFGKPITLEDHPIYRGGTLYFENNKGLVVVQKYFSPEWKSCYWDHVDYALANDIYLAPMFFDFFHRNATETDYPIYELRKIMWALRMKPLRKEDWEDYFHG